MVLPGDNVVEGFFFGDVVDDAAAVGAPVECWREALKPLLAGRIPNLQHDLRVVINLDLFVGEVGADCGLKGIGEEAFLEEVDEGGLADAGVANHNQFYEALPWLRLIDGALGCVHGVHICYFLKLLFLKDILI